MGIVGDIVKVWKAPSYMVDMYIDYQEFVLMRPLPRWKKRGIKFIQRVRRLLTGRS